VTGGNHPAIKGKGRRSIKDLQISLAKRLIQLHEGQRLPSIRNLASSTHMSVGSVSAVLNDLEDMGAVKIQKRGHLGSLVVKLSLGDLWNLVEQGPLVVGMTLPMHRRFEGLATGVKRALEQAGVETYLIFIRGSRTRLKALDENRCHVALMSGLAADELRGERHTILLTLPPGSWVSGYCIFYRELPLDHTRPLRVAVDPDSFDHRRLTDLVFAGQAIEQHLAPFVQFSRLLKNGEVDATVWTSDQQEAYLGSGILQKPLSDEAMQVLGAKSISAAFVGRSESDALQAVLKAAINPEEILDIQNKIAREEQIPEY
jgi:hypothetical protein